MLWAEAVYIPTKPLPPEKPDALPEIPDFYLRPELIPVKESDDTPLIADAYVRAGGGG